MPGMPRALHDCGISGRQFFKTCNASFKPGVLFDKRNTDRKGQPIGYIDPFTGAPFPEGVEAGAYFAGFGAGKISRGLALNRNT